MIIYAVLYIYVARGLSQTSMAVTSLLMAFIVSTIYAILIAQFRRRDIAILKCVSWSNSEILLLLIGEVVLVSFSSFLIVFQVSVEILGLMAYFGDFGSSLLQSIHAMIAVDAGPMATTLFYIVILQIPGLVLAQLRAMSIPPMRALREE
ncbi:MAG: hypothetical protein ACFFEF_00810 [Candidatus Thorarchaeota archaeon]